MALTQIREQYSVIKRKLGDVNDNQGNSDSPKGLDVNKAKELKTKKNE